MKKVNIIAKSNKCEKLNLPIDAFWNLSYGTMRDNYPTDYILADFSELQLLANYFHLTKNYNDTMYKILYDRYSDILESQQL